MISRKKMASLIDQTLLKPDATKDDITRLCQEAINFGFHSVCINPSYVSLAARILKDSQVKVCNVVGFPLGANTPEVKTFEAKKAIRDGTDEIDMVINLGALKSGNYELVKREIRDVVEQGVSSGRETIIKVIIETGLLSDEEKVMAYQMVKESRANFVKTSTGLNIRGATVQNVKFIRKSLVQSLVSKLPVEYELMGMH